MLVKFAICNIPNTLARKETYCWVLDSEEHAASYENDAAGVRLRTAIAIHGAPFGPCLVASAMATDSMAANCVDSALPCFRC